MATVTVIRNGVPVEMSIAAYKKYMELPKSQRETAMSSPSYSTTISTITASGPGEQDIVYDVENNKAKRRRPVYVQIGGTYATQEQAQAAASAEATREDVSNVRTQRTSGGYVVRGKYSGSPSNIKVTQQVTQQDRQNEQVPYNVPNQMDNPPPSIGPTRSGMFQEYIVEKEQPSSYGPQREILPYQKTTGESGMELMGGITHGFGNFELAPFEPTIDVSYQPMQYWGTGTVVAGSKYKAKVPTIFTKSPEFSVGVIMGYAGAAGSYVLDVVAPGAGLEARLIAKVSAFWKSKASVKIAELTKGRWPKSASVAVETFKPSRFIRAAKGEVTESAVKKPPSELLELRGRPEVIEKESYKLKTTKVNEILGGPKPHVKTMATKTAQRGVTREVTATEAILLEGKKGEGKRKLWTWVEQEPAKGVILRESKYRVGRKRVTPEEYANEMVKEGRLKFFEQRNEPFTIRKESERVMGFYQPYANRIVVRPKSFYESKWSKLSPKERSALELEHGMKGSDIIERAHQETISHELIHWSHRAIDSTTPGKLLEKAAYGNERTAEWFAPVFVKKGGKPGIEAVVKEERRGFVRRLRPVKDEFNLGRVKRVKQSTSYRGEGYGKDVTTAVDVMLKKPKPPKRARPKKPSRILERRDGLQLEFEPTPKLLEEELSPPIKEYVPGTQAVRLKENTGRPGLVPAGKLGLIHETKTETHAAQIQLGTVAGRTHATAVEEGRLSIAGRRESTRFRMKEATAMKTTGRQRHRQAMILASVQATKIAQAQKQPTLLKSGTRRSYRFGRPGFPPYKQPPGPKWRLPKGATRKRKKEVALKKSGDKEYSYASSLVGAFLEKPVRKPPKLTKTGLVSRPRLI